MESNLQTLVLVESWTDPRFRSLLEESPALAVAHVAEKHGLPVPKGLKFKVVHDRPDLCHIVLSESPAGAAPPAGGVVGGSAVELRDSTDSNLSLVSCCCTTYIGC